MPRDRIKLENQRNYWKNYILKFCLQRKYQVLGFFVWFALFFFYFFRIFFLSSFEFPCPFLFLDGEWPYWEQIGMKDTHSFSLVAILPFGKENPSAISGHMAPQLQILSLRQFGVANSEVWADGMWRKWCTWLLDCLLRKILVLDIVCPESLPLSRMWQRWGQPWKPYMLRTVKTPPSSGTTHL